MTTNANTTAPKQKIVVSTSTVIKQCDCKNIYQDKTYGKGMRVKNSMIGKSGSALRCTVCGKEAWIMSEQYKQSNPEHLQKQEEMNAIIQWYNSRYNLYEYYNS